MVTRLVLAALLLCSAAAAPADIPPPEDHPISKDTREKMAQVHEEIAACLRSDKSLQECHNEIMKSCHEKLGEEGCRMMPGMGHRLQDRHRMQPNGTTPQPGGTTPK
jgi:hypothetical protein